MKDMPERFRRLVLTSLSQMRWLLVVAALALVGVTLSSLLAPWPLKIIFDHILLDKPLPEMLGFLDPLFGLGQGVALLIMAL